jgi:hypothetical protein
MENPQIARSKENTASLTLYFCSCETIILLEEQIKEFNTR